MEALGIISGDAVLFIIRLTVGVLMIYYGWPKVKNLKKNSKDFEKMGFSPGWITGDIVAFTEFVGGIAMIAGIWPGLVATAFGFEMLTGFFWKLKIGKSFSDYSYDLQLFVLSLAVMVFGGGAFVLMRFEYVPLTRWDTLVVAVVIAFVLAALGQPRAPRRRKK